LKSNSFNRELAQTKKYAMSVSQLLQEQKKVLKQAQKLRHRLESKIRRKIKWQQKFEKKFLLLPCLEVRYWLGRHSVKLEVYKKIAGVETLIMTRKDDTVSAGEFMMILTNSGCFSENERQERLDKMLHSFFVGTAISRVITRRMIRRKFANDNRYFVWQKNRWEQVL